MVDCLYLVYYTKMINEEAIYINKLLLAPFSPLDIKCKKLSLMRKTTGNVFLGHLGEKFFHFFPRLH